MNWYGWSHGAAVGTLTSPPLKGSGTAKIQFGNCWDAGRVKLYLNDQLIDSASPNLPTGPATRLMNFSFVNGDVVKLKDEDGNAVVNLKSFTVVCSGVQPCVTLPVPVSMYCTTINLKKANSYTTLVYDERSKTINSQLLL